MIFAAGRRRTGCTGYAECVGARGHEIGSISRWEAVWWRPPKWTPPRRPESPSRATEVFEFRPTEAISSLVTGSVLIVSDTGNCTGYLPANPTIDLRRYLEHDSRDRYD